MRRFRLTGPEVLVGGTSFQRLSQTIHVADGKIAVLADDDPRANDLAISPYFHEVDEDGKDIEPSEHADPETSDDDVTIHEADKTRRKTKSPADNGGV